MEGGLGWVGGRRGGRRHAQSSLSDNVSYCSDSSGSRSHTLCCCCCVVGPVGGGRGTCCCCWMAEEAMEAGGMRMVRGLLLISALRMMSSRPRLLAGSLNEWFLALMLPAGRHGNAQPGTEIFNLPAVTSSESLTPEEEFNLRKRISCFLDTTMAEVFSSFVKKEGWVVVVVPPLRGQRPGRLLLVLVALGRGDGLIVLHLPASLRGLAGSVRTGTGTGEKTARLGALTRPEVDVTGAALWNVLGAAEEATAAAGEGS
ncbi:hypothetical protein CRUP_005714 [Coryphaenoides rupestris]|nr:hypothetical protein CRUP_005714 [Coryphaenoides rupestris]